MFLLPDLVAVGLLQKYRPDHGGDTGDDHRVIKSCIYIPGLRDHRQAWTLDSDGRYTQIRAEPTGDGPEAVGTHETLMRLARERLGE